MTCRKGLHERTPENTGKQGRCKECAAELKRRNRDRINARRRERYLADPDYAERTRRAARERYAATPEPRLEGIRKRYRQMKANPDLHEKRLAQNRHYMRTKGKAKRAERLADPEYRERSLARRRELYAARMANDPAWRERNRERFRIYQAGLRRAAGIVERNWGENGSRSLAVTFGERVPTAPLAAWLEAWARNHPGESWRALGRQVGVHDRRLYAIRSGETPNVTLAMAAQILDRAGASTELVLLYPMDGTAPVLPEVRDARPRARVLDVPAPGCRSGDGCPRPAGYGPNRRFCEHHGPELDRVFAELNPTADQHADFDKRRRRAFVNGAAYPVAVEA